MTTLQESIERRAWEIAQGDLFQFIKTFVWTMDEHDEENPIKRFPDLPVIEELCWLWQDLKKGEHLIIAKSRQLLASWWAIALTTWECLRLPGRLGGVVSKKEDDACKLIGETRLGLIYQYLPTWLKMEHPINQTESKVTFRHEDKPPSIVMAMPQGADQARMHTFSFIIWDEAAFQDQLEPALVGAKPTLHGGGKLLLISSASPGPFQRIYEGEW